MNVIELSKIVKDYYNKSIGNELISGGKKYLAASLKTGDILEIEDPNMISDMHIFECKRQNETTLIKLVR